ncbi:hypothetical protein PG996_001563 [Apiospora saccharicola]|uniref:Uncharacterized protein n=1 Tax=Apiospora saccharicola TaxID=335842 RepID=A0ABR1WH36_9PEZI
MAPSGRGGGDRAQEDAGAGQDRATRFLQTPVSPIDRLVGSAITGIAVDHSRDHSALLRRVDNMMREQSTRGGSSASMAGASSAGRGVHGSITSNSTQGVQRPLRASASGASGAD